MENQVQYMVEWTVSEGALDTVKQMVSESVESVEANEAKMMAFHWYVNEEQSKFYLLEWFEDADAIVDHFANIGESLGELLNYAQITRYEVYGDLTDGAEEAVTALGADKFAHFDGFTRQNEQMQDNGHRGNQVQYIVEWSVNEGALDTVKQMAAESVESVEANEPKMMAFHWYVNKEQNKFYLVEWFEDADAIVDHFANIGESLGELLNHAQIARYEVFGDLTEEARQAVESLGAQTLGHWDGFTR